MINDFIHAALPWIMVALAVAVFIVGNATYGRRKASESTLTDDERVLLRKKRNERMATCVAVGILCGVAVGVTPLMDIPAGAACGALLGMTVGWIINTKKSAK